MKQSTKVTSDPLVNLGIAVVRRAVEDCVIKRKLLLKGRRELAGLVTDPEYYLFENESLEFPSFLCVCDMVGSDPEYLRGFIRGYLLDQNVPVGLSTFERVRIKIRVSPGQEIMRSDLMRWVSDNFKMKKDGLDKVLLTLKKKDQIVTQRKRRGRSWATFYLWTGE